MLSDGRHNHSCTLVFGFLCEYPAHDASVVIVQVADGLVQEDEVEWLAEAADESHPLLLAEGELPGFLVSLVGNAENFEKGEDIFLLLVIGEAVLELDVFEGGQFGKDAQFLEKDAERVLAYLHPFVDGERADVPFVEVDDALVVTPIAVDIAAKRRFACAGGRFYEVTLPFAERNVLMPYVGGDGITFGKHLG